MNDFTKNSPIVSGIILLIISGFLFIYYLNSKKRNRDRINKSIFSKTSNIDLIILIITLFLIGLVNVFKGL